jgi:hypothetical protein
LADENAPQRVETSKPVSPGPHAISGAELGLRTLGPSSVSTDLGPIAIGVDDTGALGALRVRRSPHRAVLP